MPVSGTNAADIHITRLKANSAELHVCAAWRYEAFLTSYGYSLQDSIDQLTKLATRPEGCEAALVAMAGGEPAGVCLLVREEFEALHQVSPWLASLYVAPLFRNRGVARKLVAAVEEHALNHGVRRLHLYTGDAEAFYVKCGWVTSEHGVAGGEPYVFMVRDLWSNGGSNGLTHSVIPGLVPGIFLFTVQEDGRDKPGHDEKRTISVDRPMR